MNTSERERLGRVAFEAALRHGASLGEGATTDTWESIDEAEREGFRKMGEAVADALAPSPIRYRRVSLNGHLSLGVCRVVEVQVAGATMLAATTLCDEVSRTVEFPASSVYRLDVMTELGAIDAAREASERRAAVACAEEERTRREAREQAMRRETRANVTAVVTVFGPHVEVIVTDAGGVPRGDLLRRDDAEVIAALRAVEIEPYTAHGFCAKGGLVSHGLEITYEAAKASVLVEMLRDLGFGTVERLPDQPARVEVPDEEIPFDPAPVGGDMT